MNHIPMVSIQHKAMQIRTRQHQRRRRGLAPLELVLWLPVLMFVTALLVNYGTAAAWRVRAEINSRDASGRDITPRTGRNEPRTTNWPRGDGVVYSSDDPVQIAELDDPAIDHPVVKGPIPNGFEVHPILDPDSRGLIRGTTEIDREYALLPTLGQFNSGRVRNAELDDSWAISRMYFSGASPIPNEDLFQSASWEVAANFDGNVHRFSTLPNYYRRSKIIYRLPEVSGGMSGSVVSAMRSIMSSSLQEQLRVLDRDRDFIRYRGSAPDFHPRARILCELDRERVREVALERHVIDYLDPRREVRLGAVTRLPATLTGAFLGLYRSELRRLQAIQPPTPAITAEISILEGKINQLEQYRRRWPDIEKRLKQSSTAR